MNEFNFVVVLIANDGKERNGNNFWSDRKKKRKQKSVIYIWLTN